MDWQKSEILVGITGGIAAYKAAILVSRLVSVGAGVSVIMTGAATRLVCPKTFQALTNRTVRTDLWNDTEGMGHLDAGRRADLLVIAPATANILAKAAHGIADDLLSTTILAFDGPVLLAPAMNTVMWNRPATQRNVATLTSDGFYRVGPNTGRLGCGDVGVGRMAEPDEIFAAMAEIFGIV